MVRVVPTDGLGGAWPIVAESSRVSAHHRRHRDEMDVTLGSDSDIVSIIVGGISSSGISHV